MRIAVAGAHRTGKTTLVEALAAALPGYEVVDEPYRLLEDDGYDFADPPTPDDFAAQLGRSIDVIRAARGANIIFDRSPLDLIAYLGSIDRDDWEPSLGEAMARLDAIVLVSIETPDRIAVGAHEDRRSRRRVDEAIATLVLDDPHGFGVRAIEVSGSVDARVAQVVALIGTA